jgi:HTH-type transcriptional regulator / antitoxin HipB
MHPIRIGRIVRTLRRRRGWRQIDLARGANVSQQTVSRVERGRTGELSLRALARVLQEVEAELELNVRWRGGELDRVADEGHAHLVAATIERLEMFGWTAVPEVTYLMGRDRGSIDVLALQPVARAVLVVEVKSELTSVEATLRRLDEKVRHAAGIARSRFGWPADMVSRMLVLPDASTPRRRIERHAALFDRAFPLRGSALRSWLRYPTGSHAMLLFLSPTQRASDRRDLASRRRVRRPGPQLVEHERARINRLQPIGFIDSSVEHSPNE